MPLLSLKSIFNFAFDFTGRSKRKEFWMTFLVFILGFQVVKIIDEVTENSDFLAIPFWHSLGLFTCWFCLVFGTPLVSVCIRRLHDAGYSGYWVLLAPLYYIGGIYVLMIFMALDSEWKDNKYGPKPS